MLKNGICANRNEHQKRKIEVFGTKTDLKIAKTAKPKIPMHPLLREGDFKVALFR